MCSIEAACIDAGRGEGGGGGTIQVLDFSVLVGYSIAHCNCLLSTYIEQGDGDVGSIDTTQSLSHSDRVTTAATKTLLMERMKYLEGESDKHMLH